MIPAINVENLHKFFPNHSNQVLGPIMSSLRPWKQDKANDFHILDDLNFSINSGEVVGIVGSNGAGKTTLLKIIAGMLSPTSGKVKINGRITLLLAMGVGINQEFTGRENILYSGMLLGMSKKEVLQKMNNIIEFSELGPYIDQPVRTYSSGMRARLLFSISSSIQPEILIVDEALATGDAYFVEKAMARIREICTSGATVLFVSHNLQQISQLCSRALLLSQGKIIIDGSPAEVLDKYNKLNIDKQEKKTLSERNRHNYNLSSDRILLESINFRDDISDNLVTLFTGKKISLDLHFQSKVTGSFDLFIGFQKLPNLDYVAEFNTVGYVNNRSGLEREKINFSEGMNKITIDFSHLNTLNGHYTLWIIVYSGGDYLYEGKALHRFFVTRENNSHLISDALYSLSVEGINSTKV